MKKFYICVQSMFLWCVCLPFIISCGVKESQSSGKERSYPYQIVTTVGMVNDIVQHVVGEKAEARNIIGEGVDPHLYKSTRNDVAALLDADVIFYAGLMLEGKMADVLVKVARTGKPVYAVTELIDEKYLLQPIEFSGHYDPHVWMDVQGWIKGVAAVAQALSEYDPSHATYYKENAQKYRADLEQLHTYVLESMSTIPPSSRVLITAHDAFNYFGRAYGLEVKGIQGISTESEAGVQDINQLVDIIVARDVKAVFVETSVAEKNIRALVEGANARGKEVVIGGSLFSDAMGMRGTYEGTYMGMIDHNATTIVRALGGTVPDRGMQDNLPANKKR
ncbi:MAG: manganese transporter [Kiritimatiellae bacterium]|nr:manganese transporter [Kiritimatiellia bacterium]